VLLKARFWQRHAQTLLSERQLKVLIRLLDAYGLEFVDGLAARRSARYRIYQDKVDRKNDLIKIT